MDDHKDVATMSAGRAEEDEGRMVPRPVEQQERMLGNKHGVVGEHQNYITKIDYKHGEYIAKIGIRWVYRSKQLGPVSIKRKSLTRQTRSQPIDCKS